MRRTRVSKRLRIGLMAVGGMAAIVGTAYAITQLYYVPCTPATLWCDGGEPEWCFCDQNWYDTANWTGGDYPDTSSDRANIEHSNTGTCYASGQYYNPCSSDANCKPGRTCKKVEKNIDLGLNQNETFGGLHLVTTSTTASLDHLNVDITGGYGVTVSHMYLDASNGAVHLAGDVQTN